MKRITMKGEALGSIVETILKQGKNYGQAPKKNKSVDVEYVSANPTGDLHLGHTRGAALGDAIANLYAKAGYDVTREYYVNNCGNQVEHLGHSLSLRYHELFGEKITLGDDDYHGALNVQTGDFVLVKDGLLLASSKEPSGLLPVLFSLLDDKCEFTIYAGVSAPESEAAFLAEEIRKRLSSSDDVISLRGNEKIARYLISGEKA